MFLCRIVAPAAQTFILGATLCREGAFSAQTSCVSGGGASGSGNPRAANFSSLQPLRPRNQFHHPLDVAGALLEVRGGFGGVALEGVGKAGGNEGRLSGGEF